MKKLTCFVFLIYLFVNLSGCAKSAAEGGMNSRIQSSTNDFINKEISTMVVPDNDSGTFSVINDSSTSEGMISLVDSNPTSKATPASLNTSTIKTDPRTPTRAPTNTPTYPVLTTREKLNDVSSHVWNGYYYFFENENNDVKAIYKKKLNSSEGVIKILSVSCPSFEVLNNYIYYNNSEGKIFRMDLDGGNIKQLYDKCYIIHQVAGNWIFANHDGQIYMLSIDGTRIKLLSPDTAYDYAQYTAVYGFDHGFCYYFAQNQWYSKNQNNPQSIKLECATVKNRVDYRSDDPFIEDYTKYLVNDQLNILKVIYGKAFLMGSNTSCKYVDLISGKQKEICTGIKNGLSFLNDYVFFTHEENTQDASGQNYSTENFRFVNINNGNITDFDRDFYINYYLDYEDINNNSIFFHCNNNSTNTSELVRYTADGTKEVLYRLDLRGNFIP